MDLLLDFEQGGVQCWRLCGDFGKVGNMGGAAVCRECAKHRIRPVLYGDAVLHPEHIVHLVHFAPFVFVQAVDVGVHCECYRVVTENGRQCFVIHAALQRTGGEGVAQGVEGKVSDVGILQQAVIVILEGFLLKVVSKLVGDDTVKQLLDKITWDDGVNLTAERFLCSRYAVPREIGAEIKEKRELWKEILDGRMDESSMPEGESWSYLEDTAGSIEEATYRLKNMALLDYITECFKTKKESQ